MDRKEAIERIQEVMTIIRTQHMCKDMDGECTTEDRETYIQHFEALRMAIEALQEPERKWIPVSERLPKEYETVIGITDLNYYCIAVYCKQYGFRSMDVGVESDIIAWQPLPEPYKGGKRKR